MTNQSKPHEFAIQSHRTSRSTVIIDGSWREGIRDLGPRRLLIADAQLESWVSGVAAAIQADGVLTMPMGEHQKSLATVNDLYEWLGAQGAMRDTVVAALGGGVCTDMVGFAAATYLRGLTWAAIPTTLLAQVDAAIGGKVGVNTPLGKNLVGAFHLPRIVAIETEFLATLPRREWKAGVGEVLKSALIQGGWLYDALDRAPLMQVADWADIVRETAHIKVDVVNQDLYENGPRMYLNLGHTIGHALENLLGYGAMTHGEAVALGTLAVLRLSEETQGLSQSVRQRVLGWMARWGLATRMPTVDFGKLWEQLHRDKKARSQGLTWVLLRDLGDPVLVQNLEEALVRSVVEELQE